MLRKLHHFYTSNVINLPVGGVISEPKMLRKLHHFYTSNITSLPVGRASPNITQAVSLLHQ